MFKRSVKIGTKLIGIGRPTFIIAEIGPNHDGKVKQAKKLIKAAVDCRVDAVKFQAYTPRLTRTQDSPMADYQHRSQQQTAWEMTNALKVTLEQFRDVKAYCDKVGVMFLVSVFDHQAMEEMREFGMAAIKTGSGEILNLPLMRALAEEGVPMLVSTGMHDLEEVKRAVEVIGEARNNNLVLFHCVSLYPTEPRDVNLRAMQTLRDEFGCPVGFSDHTEGIHIPVAAVAEGADILEMHFTIDKNLPGPDHAASLEPKEMATVVMRVRELDGLSLADRRVKLEEWFSKEKLAEIKEAQGNGVKTYTEKEKEMRTKARRSWHVLEPVRKGEPIVFRENVYYVKPWDANGLEPGDLEVENLAGAVAKRDLGMGELLKLTDIVFKTGQ